MTSSAHGARLDRRGGRASALKLGAGLISGGLGLISEALHSGTNLVAALLTFFAIGVSGDRPTKGTSTDTGRPSISLR